MLPDGGVKLEKQVSDLTQQIGQLDLAIERDKKVLDALPAPTPGVYTLGRGFCLSVH